MTKALAKAASLVIASALLLASCGDDDDPASTASPTSDPGTTLPAEPGPDDSGTDDSDPAGDPAGIELSEPAADLAAALTCPETREHPEVPGVLLVPGTGLGSEENWGLTLGASLPAEGYDTCTVDLLESATGDIQRSAEYVVAAIRAMSDAGYDEISIVAFSQGVLASRWALAWWPDVRDPVVDLVGIAGPSGGAAATAQLCAATPCAAALQQMTAGSEFLAALDRQWAGVDGIEVTLIASTTDTVISVDEVDAVDGATLVVVQDVCPEREVDHVPLVADGVVSAIVLDALGNDGTASSDRLDAGVCDAPSVAADGWDPQAVNDAAFGVIVTATAIDAEPPLAPYAR
jgi:triacylglycerol lipase